MLTDAERKERLNGIGASDTSIIMGFSSYKTPYELYLEKTGLVSLDDDEMNEQQYWGHRLERIILDEFAAKNDVELTFPGKIHHPKYDFMFATLDGFCPSLQAVVEAKNSNAFMAKTWDSAKEDGIPPQYIVQIAKQVMCAQVKLGFCAVLIGGAGYKQFTYHQDLQLEEMIVEADMAFWDCVQMRIEPNFTELSDYRLKYPESTDNKVVLPEFLLPVMEEMNDIKSMMKKWEKQMEKLKMEIMKYMKGNDVLVDEKGSTLATWKTGKKARVFLLK